MVVLEHILVAVLTSMLGEGHTVDCSVHTYVFQSHAHQEIYPLVVVHAQS